MRAHDLSRARERFSQMRRAGGGLSGGTNSSIAYREQCLLFDVGCSGTTHHSITYSCRVRHLNNLPFDPAAAAAYPLAPESVVVCAITSAVRRKHPNSFGFSIDAKSYFLLPNNLSGGSGAAAHTRARINAQRRRAAAGAGRGASESSTRACRKFMKSLRIDGGREH